MRQHVEIECTRTAFYTREVDGSENNDSDLVGNRARAITKG